MIFLAKNAYNSNGGNTMDIKMQCTNCGVPVTISIWDDGYIFIKDNGKFYLDVLSDASTWIAVFCKNCKNCEK